MQSVFDDFQWLRKYAAELANAFRTEGTTDAYPQLPGSPELSRDEPYANFIRENSLGSAERLALVLALSPYLSSGFLQTLNLKGNPAMLYQDRVSGALMPTGETFLFLASGSDESQKLPYHDILSTRHALYRNSVLDLQVVNDLLPPSYGILSIHESYRDQFLYGKFTRPRFNENFPAQLLETHLEWDDLVLNDFTQKNLGEIRAFLQHEKRLREEPEIARHMRPGYRALFYGPSGTGKTIGATLLGKEIHKDVYRVDLSMVVSKYIGETSKNLNALFNTAENKGWILFFDEGDAVFGKRSEAGNGEDRNARYANQEVAFLLQRIESYNGLVIVATNFRQNLDPAFARRFQCMVNFNLPDEESRKKIWTMNLPSGIGLSKEVSLDHLAKAHRLSAASIVRIIQRAGLQSLMKEEKTISRSTIEFCIRDEEFNNK